MIIHQELIVPRVAGADLSESEGCFVSCAEGQVSLTTAGSAPEDVYGILDTCNTKGGRVSVCLPGFHGQVMARLHESSEAVTDGDALVLAASGKVKKGDAGTLVARALADAAAGKLVPVRLVEPATLASEAV